MIKASIRSLGYFILTAVVLTPHTGFTATEEALALQQTVDDACPIMWENIIDEMDVSLAGADLWINDAAGKQAFIDYLDETMGAGTVDAAGLDLMASDNLTVATECAAQRVALKHHLIVNMPNDIFTAMDVYAGALVGGAGGRWHAYQSVARSVANATDVSFLWDGTDDSGDWEDNTAWIAPRDMDIDVSAMCESMNSYDNSSWAILKIMYQNDSTGVWNLIDWGRSHYVSDGVRTIRNNFHITQGEKIRLDGYLTTNGGTKAWAPGGSGNAQGSPGSQDTACEIVISENLSSAEARWHAYQSVARSVANAADVGFLWDSTDDSGDWEDNTAWIAPRDMDVDIRATCDSLNSYDQNSWAILKILHQNDSTGVWNLIDWGRDYYVSDGVRTIRNNFHITQGEKIRLDGYVSTNGATKAWSPGGSGNAQGTPGSQDTACEMVISEVPS